ncbi:hypothetical protein [Oceanidesulfovibrio marinus]|uniref:Uncharacterized protein n=1 Tax=Oceanidesulfovibrio marinus TaxID=370038 RepID=A0A6P1ZKJ8_9BACT|nr:hypothetical protein [Oceanidesulfovibrio marinus]TVM35614.1 hypothetical protein DQK91_02820 [Oceanidesulfovibrio marinus]
MWSALDGIGRFLGLLSNAIQAVWDAWRQRDAQRAADVIADDPAGEWVRKFRGQSTTDARQADPGDSDADA